MLTLKYFESVDVAVNEKFTLITCTIVWHLRNTCYHRTIFSQTGQLTRAAWRLAVNSFRNWRFIGLRVIESDPGFLCFCERCLVVVLDKINNLSRGTIVCFWMSHILKPSTKIYRNRRTNSILRVSPWVLKAFLSYQFYTMWLQTMWIRCVFMWCRCAPFW